MILKLEPIIELDKRNKTTSKKFDDDVMWVNCDVIVIFSIYDQFGAIRKPDSGCIVCKSYIFIEATLYFTETESRTKKSLTQLSQSCFE